MKKNPYDRARRQAAPQRNRPSRGKHNRFSFFPVLLAAGLVLGGVYWLWSYGSGTQSPLLSWLSGGRVSVYAAADGISQTEARDLYQQAIEAERAEEYPLAVKLFTQLETLYPGLENIIGYHLAIIHTKQPREDLAQLRLNALRQNATLQPGFRARVAYELLQSYMRAGEYDDAREQIKRLLNDFPNTDYALASDYYSGLIALREQEAQWLTQFKQELNPKAVQPLPEETHNAWMRYLQNSPTGTFAGPILEAFTRRETPLTPDLNTAYILYHQNSGNPEKALAFAKTGQYSPEKAGLAVMQAALAQGKRAEALELLNRWIGEVSFSREGLLAVLNQLFPSTQKPEPQTLSALQTLLESSGKGNREFVLWHLSQVDDDNQAGHYARYINAYPTGRYAPFIAAERVRFQFKAEDFERVLPAALAYLKTYPASLEAPDVALWKALAQRYRHQMAESNRSFERIQADYPNTYAAFRAASFLRANDDRHGFAPFWSREQLPLMPETMYSPEEWLREYADTQDELPPILLAQLSELAKIGAFEDIQLLIEMQLKPENPHGPILNAWAHMVDGRLDESIRLIREQLFALEETPAAAAGLDRYHLSKPVLKLLYPLHYPKIVEENARAAAVSPFLTLGLIRQESHFNPNSVSPSAAIGLMQLLVPTAQDMVNPGENLQINRLLLLNPELNVQLGTRYLNYLNAQLQEDPLLVVAAYNAGPGAVGGWASRDMETLKRRPDVFVEGIPYDQTRHYVHKVFQGMWNYYTLYNVSR